MKIPPNGSFFANALLVLGGMVVGATSYWTVENLPSVLSSESSAWDDSDPVDRRRSGGDGMQVGRRSADGEENSSWETGKTLRDRLKTASTETDSRLRSELLRRAGAEGARGDVEEALKLGHSLVREQDRIDYFRGLFGVWSEVDAESSLNYIRQHFSSGLLQSELISVVINKWGASSPQDARLWADQHLTGPIREQAMTDLMIGWTRRNPELAANWLSESGNGSAGIVAAVGATWAEQNPVAAAYWASTFPSGAIRKTASLAVANEWARQEPKAAADFYEAKLEQPEGIDLATVIADVWGTSDPASAANWISSLPAGPVRDQAAGTLATVWATRDIDAAVEWSASIQDPGMLSQVVAHLSTTWGALEPARTVDWLAGLSPELAQVGVTGAFNSWAAVDPYGMWDWLENAEPSIVTDQARRSLADVRSQDDILDSMDLALGISTSKERNDAVARYFRQWRKTDDASAQEWLNDYWSVIPPDLQKRLNQEQLLKVNP